MAVTAPPKTTMTLAEFARLPEGPPYLEREPDGEVIELSSARHRHHVLMGMLFSHLRSRIRARRLGEVAMDVEVFFLSGRVYKPDLCFVAADQGNLFGPDDKVHGTPAMVVEIVSPAGETRDRVTKFRAYQAEGVEWYWLIDAEALDIEEYHLEAGRYVCTARHTRGEVFRPGALPGCEIDLAAMMSE